MTGITPFHGSRTPTRLTVEMLVVPRLPLPGPLVTEEVTGAVAHVVNNLRKQCERLP